MTAADPCTGARWRDFLLGIRRGQPVGAHVPSWCSRHEVDAWSLPAGGPAWLAYDVCLPDAADGTGWTPPTASPCQGDGVKLSPEGGVHGAGYHDWVGHREARFPGAWGRMPPAMCCSASTARGRGCLGS